MLFVEFIKNAKEFVGQLATQEVPEPSKDSVTPEEHLQKLVAESVDKAVPVGQAATQTRGWEDKT